MKIPFVPLKPERIISIAKKTFLYSIADRLSKIHSLKVKLMQAEIGYDEREYYSIAIYSAFHWFIIIFLLLNFLSFISKQNLFLISFLLSLTFSFLSFIIILLYPNYLISKKVRDVENNLPHFLRHLLIQTRAGMSLYDCFLSISKQDYGVLSIKAKEIVKKLNAGKNEAECLEELIMEIPSIKFRRIIWQLINAIKSGIDISNVLKHLLEIIINERKAEIKMFGSKLNPITLSFLTVGVIFPTMGILFLIVLSNFVGLNLPQEIFILLIILIAIIQFNLIGVAKSLRPNV